MRHFVNTYLILVFKAEEWYIKIWRTVAENICLQLTKTKGKTKATSLNTCD